MTMRDQAARWALIGSIVGGVSYIASWGLQLPAPLELAWKGTGVGLLAVFAALKARDRDGWLLTAVMTLGVLGDVLLGVQFIVGAVAFLIGHVVAVGLYLTNRRPALSFSQRALALLLVPAAVFIAFLLPADRAARRGGVLHPGPLIDGRDRLDQPFPALHGRDRRPAVPDQRPGDLRQDGPAARQLPQRPGRLGSLLRRPVADLRGSGEGVGQEGTCTGFGTCPRSQRLIGDTYRSRYMSPP
jgi:hypothetical protein